MDHKSVPRSEKEVVKPRGGKPDDGAVGVGSQDKAEVQEVGEVANRNGDCVGVTDRCARVWGMLWSAQMKLRLPIPESMVFCNGKFHSCLFTSKEHAGEVRKKSRVMGFEDIAARFIQRADNDPSNMTHHVAVLVQSDKATILIGRDELPSVLRTLGDLPVSQKLSNHGYADAGADDLYQIVKAYVHPLNGLRFVTTFKSKAGEKDENGRVPRDRHGRVAYTLATEVRKYTERYSVDQASRDFYDHPFSQADDTRMGANSNFAEVPEAIFRECDRMTLILVDFMKRIHGVGIQYLQVEFVQSFTKRLYMHDIVDVVFNADLDDDSSSSLNDPYQSDYHQQSQQQLHRQQPHSRSNPGYGASVELPHPGSGEGEDDSQLYQTYDGGHPSNPRSSNSCGPSPRAGQSPRAAVSSAHLSMSGASSVGYNTLVPSHPSAKPSRPSSASRRPSRSSSAAQSRPTRPSTQFATRNPEPPLRRAHTSAQQLTTVSRSWVEDRERDRSRDRSDGTFQNQNQMTRSMSVGTAAAAAAAGATTETQREKDDRLMKGMRPPKPGEVPKDGQQQSDFLVFHWRHAAREANKELQHLNREMAKQTDVAVQKEQALVYKNRLLEEAVQKAQTMTRHAETESQQLRQTLQSMRDSFQQARSTHGETADQLRTKISEKDQEIQTVKYKMIETTTELDELRRRYHDREAAMLEVTATHEQLKRECEQNVERRVVAEEIRDQLLEKLESENMYTQMLVQAIDLRLHDSGGVDILLQNLPFSGDEKHDSDLLQSFEGVKGVYRKFTGKDWTDKKIQFLKVKNSAQKKHIENAQKLLKARNRA